MQVWAVEPSRRPVRNQIPLRYLVADRFETGSKSNLSATSFEPASNQIA